jgi:hypothetical protein
VHRHALRVLGIADRGGGPGIADLAGNLHVAFPCARLHKLDDGAPAPLARDHLELAVLARGNDKVLDQPLGG